MTTKKDEPDRAASKQIMNEGDYPSGTAASAPPHPEHNVSDMKAPETAEANVGPAELWAERKGLGADSPDYWKFAEARALKGWASGQLVTEQEFDEAVAASGKTKIT